MVFLQFDEEEYESMDGEMPTANRDALATLLKKSLEARAQSTASSQPVPSTQHVSAFLQQTSELPEVHLNDGYNSDEYESIKENVSV
jgi:hypothetical protein